MYAYIKGSLEQKSSNFVVIEANGVGYKIFMSDTGIGKLGELGSNVKVYTFLRVMEDDMSLYGFNTNEELRMFELLITVSGVGAKSAISILSNITPSSFALAVISNDVNKLKALPGIGPKSAQRIILELKDKIKKENEANGKIGEVSKQEDTELLSAIEDDSKVQEATQALQVLGYTRREIDAVISKVKTKDLSVEEIIRQCLSNLAR